MDMIEALEDAFDMYCEKQDNMLERAENSLDTSGNLQSWCYEQATEYALTAEAINRAIKKLEAHSLTDKAGQLRYKALELANKRIDELEKEIAELKGVVQ
jgi:hypothetical protein